jgi:antitoxin component HigA of HigAB toxin-antitoxin module
MATVTSEDRDLYLELVKDFPLRPIQSDSELDRATEILHGLLDLGPEGRRPAENDYLFVLGTLISEYEDIHYPMPCELEEREVLRLHHEAWLARHPETS